ncbi:hypothetical protein DTO271D3_8902 [Paecilomyces variotii]|nr:hypothetical protein DTO169E5_1072 [Paecilomyces variotii]KAJ9310811.1 hypothetical protein DTO271D3_8902 [Paecilomyces variotii]KAJ9322244.1 hypothetical protein DTO027B3_6681 [Paecilomyces variotii]KAJ9331946.1 hypothetical protein DTO027B5_6225 [Paecilomyces variotii]
MFLGWGSIIETTTIRRLFCPHRLDHCQAVLVLYHFDLQGCQFPFFRLFKPFPQLSAPSSLALATQFTQRTGNFRLHQSPFLQPRFGAFPARNGAAVRVVVFSSLRTASVRASGKIQRAGS